MSNIQDVIDSYIEYDDAIQGWQVNDGLAQALQDFIDTNYIRKINE